MMSLPSNMNSKLPGVPGQKKVKKAKAKSTKRRGY